MKNHWECPTPHIHILIKMFIKLTTIFISLNLIELTKTTQPGKRKKTFLLDYNRFFKIIFGETTPETFPMTL